MFVGACVAVGDGVAVGCGVGVNVGVEVGSAGAATTGTFSVFWLLTYCH